MEMNLMEIRKCPNCGNKSLKFFLGEWVCLECEYHSKKPKKEVKKSFR
jgi:ribosomal protein L37AE/L43A